MEFINSMKLQMMANCRKITFLKRMMNKGGENEERIGLHKENEEQRR